MERTINVEAVRDDYRKDMRLYYRKSKHGERERLAVKVPTQAAKPSNRGWLRGVKHSLSGTIAVRDQRGKKVYDGRNSGGHVLGSSTKKEEP